MDGDYRLVLKYLGQLKLRFPDYGKIICGYETGCLGYSIYHDLTNQGVNCIIMAPTTIARKIVTRLKPMEGMSPVLLGTSPLVCTLGFCSHQRR